jgi:DNA processing protein
VVEAPVKSGALITVTWAMEQGKDILAVPGNITSSVSEGSNRLIRDGATPILNSGDLLTALGLTVSAEQAVRPVTLSLDQSLLLNAIPDEPVPVDSLVEVLGWPPEKVQVTALELELLGMLQQFPGALLVRTAAVW